MVFPSWGLFHLLLLYRAPRSTGDMEATETKEAEDSSSSSTTFSNAAEELRNMFGLGFDHDGVLRQVEPDGAFTKNKFDFDHYPGNKEKNQRRYEKIGLLVDKVIYSFLEERGLRRIPVPKDAEKHGFFFASQDFEKSDKLMVLIHGSGVVRAGQWARRLILNDNLECGTQLPFIDRAQKMGFGVVVMNTNYNKDESTEERIPGSSSPVEHATSVWRENVAPSKARDIAVVAHSFGGIVTLELAREFQSDFENRVFSVSFTDSVHSTSQLKREPPTLLARLQKVALNYVTSDDPLGTVIDEGRKGIPEVSAGHSVHEWTSFSAMGAIFERLQKQMDKLERKRQQQHQQSPQKEGKEEL